MTTWRETFTVGERVEVETSHGWRPGTVSEVPRRVNGRLRGELTVRGDMPGQEFRLDGCPRSCVRRAAQAGT